MILRLVTKSGLKQSDRAIDRNMFKKKIRLYALFLVLVLLFPGGLGVPGAAAQEGQEEGPVYIVQEGDSLWDISLRFSVSMGDLQKANGISDPGQLAAGARLVIPGLEGIQGELVTQTMPYGETLRSLSRHFQVPADLLARLNRLTSPAELYAGATLVIPNPDEADRSNGRAMLAPGQSLLEMAVLQGTNPWTLVAANDLDGAGRALAGDVLRFRRAGSSEEATEPGEEPGALPDAIRAVSLSPTPIVQGKAAVIRISGQAGLALSGSIAGHELNFFPENDRDYVTLQGIHAMAEPGLYPLVLSGTLPDGTTFSFSQAVFISSGNYRFDPVLIVSPETIDPAVTRPEDAQWNALAAPVTPEKLWDGLFESPAPPEFSECWPSVFGSRRSYNGSGYSYFHTGLDFCGGVGTKIFAPAAGKVVFAGPMTVRGIATMIDHGWGVYTGYMHQSEITVKAGEQVEAGQVIGMVGGTGRATGPHLHWEVWAGGVQVDPFDWLEKSFP